MPYMQNFVAVLNSILDKSHIDALDPTLLAPGTQLGGTVQQLGITTPPVVEFIQSWPIGLQEAVRAALYSAVTRTPRLPVTFAWAPAYDFELNIWEAGAIPDSDGGMSILLRSRYPGDAIPNVTRPT